MCIRDRGISQRLIGSKTGPLTVVRSEPYVYVTEEIDGVTKIDLGFNQFIDKPEGANLPAPLPHPVNFGAVPHYMYKATVLEIIDGDTIWAFIHQGYYGAGTKQKLRFRGINTAEITTADGLTAKAYIETQLKACKFIAVKTYWRDKFTRYLADVFYNKDEPDLLEVIQAGMFLIPRIAG